MSSRNTTVSIVLLGAVCTLAPRATSAYVREVTSTGLPLAWKNPCVAMHVFLGDVPPVLTPDQFFMAATVSGNTWSTPFLACSDIRLSVIAEAEPTADVGYDKRNVIVFRKVDWCSNSSPAANPSDSVCYPRSALAVTTIFKNKNTGEILDTDIAFNAVDYAWGDMVALPGSMVGPTVDFQNALTHELGHVLGLDHSCYAPADGQGRQLDNTGAPELDCYNNPDLPESILNSTMYPSVSLRDTERRDLCPDDEQGVCEIYPYLHEACTGRLGGGGCATLPDSSTRTDAATWIVSTVTATLIAGLCLLLRRRRVRRI